MVRPGSSNIDLIADIARHEDPIERTNALLAFIDTLAPDEFEEAVDAFRQLGMTEARRGEYAILLSSWAKVNPTEALAYASENTGTPYARNIILSTWAGSNPDGAIAWAESNHEGEGANPWLVGVIRGLAPNDLNRATSLLESLPRSTERGDALSSMISLLVARDPEDAKNWSATIEDSYLRSGAYAYTAGAIAKKSPGEAALWLSGLNDVEALNRVSEDITGNWYRESPEEALAWVNTLPPQAMSEAAEGVVGNVVREDPIKAAEYLSEIATANPEANFESSIRELVRGSARQDPELAAVWVGGLQDARTQSRYYHYILGEWQKKDAVAANGWISQNQGTLPESIGRRFLQQEGRSAQQ